MHNVIHVSTTFQVSTSNSIEGDTITRDMTDFNTGSWTLTRLWYKMDIPLFSKKESGFTNQSYVIVAIFDVRVDLQVISLGIQSILTKVCQLL